MLGLTAHGLGRQEAHEILRQAAGAAFVSGRTLYEVLLENKQVTAVLSSRELEKLLDPAEYIGTAVAQVKNVLKKYRRVSKRRSATRRKTG
jgi:adenylosuccinate lyase